MAFTLTHKQLLNTLSANVSSGVNANGIRMVKSAGEGPVKQLCRARGEPLELAH